MIKECKFCKKEFKNYSTKVVFCSHKCSSDILKGITRDMSKAVQKKIELGKNNPKKICTCGNKKDIKAKQCINCYTENNKLKYKKICKVCNTNFIAKFKVVTICSKECIKEFKKTISKKENNHNWKGGITSENKKQRASEDYKNWRTNVFIRDNYTCQKCFIVGNKLHAHHIIHFSKNKELRTDLNNGLTLCFKCHRLEHTNIY